MSPSLGGGRIINQGRNYMHEDTLVELKNAVGRMGEELREVTTNFETHRQVEDVVLKTLDSNMKDILIAIKSQNTAFDSTMLVQRNHIENKIDSCYDKMTKTLEDYVTKDGILLIKDKALSDAKKERTVEIKEAKTELQAEIEKVNSRLWKSAKSHLTVFWIIATVAGLLSGFIFINLKDAFHIHENKPMAHHYTTNGVTYSTNGKTPGSIP